MRQLTGQDTIYLTLEDEETTTHVTALMIMDQGTAPKQLVTFKQILEHVENCLPDLPMLKQKLVNIPFQLDYPFLGYDEGFDLEFHVRHVALPQPGDWRQLCIQTARIHSRGLDLRKPLWEMYIIEGINNTDRFPQGSFAVLLKIHHALVDGGALNYMVSKLLDTSANAAPRRPKTSVQTRAPARSEALVMAAKSATLRPFAFVKLLSGLTPRYMRSKLKTFGAGRPKKPKTLFNGHIGKNRTIEGCDFDLDRINAIRSLVKGSTLNDVVMALSGGALREYLLKYDDLPETSLIAGAPVNLNPDRKSVSENNISLLQFPIHSDIADPKERLKAVYESSCKIKREGEENGNHTIGALSKQIPAPLLTVAASALYKSGLISSMGQLFNLIISNVPGPRQPLYFCGAEMKAMYGYAPLAHTLGLFLTQYSYNGKLFFGITGDRTGVRNPEELVSCLIKVFNEYQDLLKTSPKKPARRKVARKAGSKTPPKRKKTTARRTGSSSK